MGINLSSTARAFALVLGLGFGLVIAAPDARAGEKSGVSGKAPPKKEKAPSVSADTSSTVFRSDAFGESDAASDRTLKKLVTACAESPFSREGMDRESAARCDVQVARAVQHGKKAIPSVLRLLERSADPNGSSDVGYYARTRLFHVLGKIDSAELEESLLAGMSKIAKDKNDERAEDANLAHEALVRMNGIDPTGLAVADAGAVENTHVAIARRVAAWRAFQKEHAGEKKNKVRAAMISKASTEAKSKDNKTRYLALSALTAQSPRRARTLVEAAMEDMTEEEKAPYQELSDMAWALEPRMPEHEVLPPRVLPKKKVAPAKSASGAKSKPKSKN